MVSLTPVVVVYLYSLLFKRHSQLILIVFAESYLPIIPRLLILAKSNDVPVSKPPNDTNYATILGNLVEIFENGINDFCDGISNKMGRVPLEVIAAQSKGKS